MNSRLVALLASLLICWASGATAMTADDRENLARTAEAHAADSPVATPAATTRPVADVSGRTVVYGRVAGQPVSGYLVRPSAATGPLPGLIVIHEWWGLNDNVRAEAARLAAQGYVVLAVDLYRGKVATEPREAMKLSQWLTTNADLAEDNLHDAYAYLDRVEAAPRIGTIGWCLGGRWSLRAALILPDKIDATVIYYGTVKVDEADLARLQMPVLGLFGSNDRVVPVATVRAFEAAMKRQGKNLDLHIYDGADHAFANPSGTAYEPVAAEDAWRRTTAFLRENLQR